MLPRRVTLALCALLLAAGLAACGAEEPGIEEPAREGLALELGGIEYNVFITRQLNPAIPPDEAYYDGPPPNSDETVWGVFMQVCNRSEESHETAEAFTVTDNQGNEFEPTELPRDNSFAYRPETLDPQQCIPRAGSVAQLGPTAGAMLLFELPLDTTENRPLELEIENPSGGEPEALTFELDL